MNESKRAVRTVSLMVGATALSKVLGLARNIIQAKLYGAASPEIAAFNAAWDLQLNLFDVLLAATLLGSFIPVYNSFKNRDGSPSPEARRFTGAFLGAVGLLSGLIALIGILFARPLIGLIAADFDAGTVDLAARLLRMMFPVVVISSFSYTLVGVLQSGGRYLAPALMSAVSNVAIIIYFLTLNNRFGVVGLAVAYLVGWVIQLFTLAVPLWKDGFRVRMAIDFANQGLRRVFRTALPIMAGAWLGPVSGIIALAFSAVYVYNCFGYAKSIYLLVAGIITYGIGNYVFPRLSRLSAEGDSAAFRGMARSGISSTLLITVPVALAALVLRGEIIAVLYHGGAFTLEMVRSTSTGLMVMAPAIVAFAMIEIMSRVYYAAGKVRIPMTAAFVGIAVNLAVSFALSRAGAGLAGVAAGYGLGQVASALVMVGFSASRLKGTLNRDFAVDAVKIALAGGAMFAVMVGVQALVGVAPGTAGKMRDVVTAVGAFLPGIAVYAGMVKIMRVSLLHA